MGRFKKKRSKVVHCEVDFIDQLKSTSLEQHDEDSGYGAEKDQLNNRIKSFSCEDLLTIGTSGCCSQKRRRQSTANVTNINTKSTSSSSSITSEEHTPTRPYLCSVSIDGKGQCQVIKDESDEATFENEPIKYRPKKPTVHLKVNNIAVYVYTIIHTHTHAYYNNYNFFLLAF